MFMQFLSDKFGSARLKKYCPHSLMSFEQSICYLLNFKVQLDKNITGKVEKKFDFLEFHRCSTSTQIFKSRLLQQNRSNTSQKCIMQSFAKWFGWCTVLLAVNCWADSGTGSAHTNNLKTFTWSTESKGPPLLPLIYFISPVNLSHSVKVLAPLVHIYSCDDIQCTATCRSALFNLSPMNEGHTLIHDPSAFRIIKCGILVDQPSYMGLCANAKWSSIVLTPDYQASIKPTAPICIKWETEQSNITCLLKNPSTEPASGSLLTCDYSYEIKQTH